MARMIVEKKNNRNMNIMYIINPLWSSNSSPLMIFLDTSRNRHSWRIPPFHVASRPSAPRPTPSAAGLRCGARRAAAPRASMSWEISWPGNDEKKGVVNGQMVWKVEDVYNCNNKKSSSSSLLYCYIISINIMIIIIIVTTIITILYNIN